MTLQRVWIVASVGLAVLAGLIAPMSTVDLAYAVRTGQLIAETAAIPAVDPYTFTVGGTPWIDQQWGAQVIFAALFAVAGWEGLVVARGILIGAAVALLIAASVARGASVRTAALVAVAALLIGSPGLAMRAQLLGVVCFAASLALVSVRRRFPLAPLAVPVVAALWANFHGSFVLAPVIVAWALFEDDTDHTRRWRMAALAVVTPLATLVNPFGVGAWAYAAGLVTDPRIRELVTEWQTPAITSPVGLAFYLSVAATLALMVRRRRDVAWPTWLWIGLLIAMGLMAQRNVVWWAFGASVVVAPLLTPATGIERPGDPRLNAVVMAVVGILLFMALPWWRSLPSSPEQALLRDAPIGVTAALEVAAPPGARIRAPQEWGSWFELEVPARQVAVDSRIELFPFAVWSDHLVLSRAAPGWEGVLERWAPDVVATSTDESALRAALTAAGWQLNYEDGEGAVLVPPRSPVAARGHSPCRGS